MLKKREEELLAEMKIQLHKWHAEMKKQTVEAVEAAVAGSKADLARADSGQHFVNSLAEAMNDMPQLRQMR